MALYQLQSSVRHLIDADGALTTSLHDLVKARDAKTTMHSVTLALLLASSAAAAPAAAESTAAAARAFRAFRLLST